MTRDRLSQVDDQTRTRVAAAGGRGRAATMSTEQRALGAAVAARAAHTPLALARRIARAWPTLTPAERVAVRAVLAELVDEQAAS